MNPTERLFALTFGGLLSFPSIPYCLGLEESTYFTFAVIGAVFGFSLWFIREVLFKKN